MVLTFLIICLYHVHLVLIFLQVLLLPLRSLPKITGKQQQLITLPNYFYSLIPCETWWPFITLDDFCTRLTDCRNDSALFSFPTIPAWVEFECTLAQGDNIICESNLAIPLNVCSKRFAKSRYKYEVRWLLHHKQFITHAMMAAAIASSDPKMAHLVLIIFHNFSLHYTTFWTHKIIMVVTHSMFTSLYASLKAADLNDLIVSEECVDCAFAHLKCGKSNSTSTLSDQLIYALPALCRPLVPRHPQTWFMPKSLRNCILVPTPKASISDNYLPISVVPTLSKALEWCILLIYPKHFLTSGLQFSFKAKYPLRSALERWRMLLQSTCM